MIYQNINQHCFYTIIIYHVQQYNINIYICTIVQYIYVMHKSEKSKLHYTDIVNNSMTHVSHVIIYTIIKKCVALYNYCLGIRILKCMD